MDKVLISGANGFVGTNLSAYLKKYDFAVSKLGRFNPNKARDKQSAFTWKDLTGIRESSLQSIIHLASKAHDLKNVSQPEEYYEVNYKLTTQLYDTFLQSNAKIFIFISTVKAVADHLDGPLTEDHKPNPQTHYGKSKLMAEQYIQSQVLPEGKSYYILRPCMIHGPGNKGNLNLLYQFVSKGFPYPLAAFENKRSFLSVGNFCFIIKELLSRNDIPSGIYNLADDQDLSTNQLVSLLAEALEKPPRLMHVPVGLVAFAARIGDFLKLPLNTERLGKLTQNYVVSNKKLNNILLKKLPLASAEGILLTIKAFDV
jgi:nucleoside-diphosphate-sugar epimerase